MKHNILIPFILLTGFASCNKPVLTKTEYKTDTTANREYKEVEYQYITGVDADGNEIEIRHGLTKEFYPSGQISAELHYDEGKLNGEIKTFFENGRPGEVSNWKNDSLHGVAKYYYSDGYLYQQRNYKNGRLDGEETVYHENGKLSKKIIHKEDLIWQVIANYDTAGNLLDENTVQNGTGVLNMYFPGGSIKSRTELKNGEIHGKLISYFENGNEQLSIQFVHGKKQGVLQRFYDNGKLAGESNYEDDFIVGSDRSYNRDGLLVLEMSYKNNLTREEKESLTESLFSGVRGAIDPAGLLNGIRHGAYKIYYDNGKLKSEEYYFENRQDSLFREYYENGVMKTDMFIDEDYEYNTRYHKTFDKKGKLVTSRTFPLRGEDSSLTKEQKELKRVLDSAERN